MRIDAKGQLTIPAVVMQQFNLFPNAEVEVVEQDNRITIIKKESENKKPRFKTALELRKAMSKHRGNGMTTDEVMLLTRGYRLDDIDYSRKADKDGKRASLEALKNSGDIKITTDEVMLLTRGYRLSDQDFYKNYKKNHGR